MLAEIEKGMKKSGGLGFLHMYENHHLFDIGAKCNGAALEEQKAS